MVSHHPALFSGHRYYGSGDKMFLYCVSLKDMAWNHTAYHKSNPGHMRLKQQ